MFSGLNLETRRNLKLGLTLAGLASFSSIVYLLVSGWYFRVGFPLDDAWIHQTYARNLVVNGEWAFLPGQVSGGSTSPLWTMMLAIGYFLKIPALVWSSLLGTMLLWGCAWLVEVGARAYSCEYQSGFPWIGALVVFEWHLAWAAVSGMETLGFALLVLGFQMSVLLRPRRWFLSGILAGVSTWMRPEGMLLLIPAVGLEMLDASRGKKEKVIGVCSLLAGFLLIFGSYVLFNYSLSGTPFPSTFYAKQSEYATVFGMGSIMRLGEFSLQLLVGVGVITLPGFILAMVEIIREKKWIWLTGAVWIGITLCAYAWKLPQVYQHGRYMMPTIPIYLMISCIGLARYFRKSKIWLVKTTWKASLGIVMVVFWMVGAVTFGRDVAVIESEMVDTARWVADNLPEDALVAAHDIGALGYFGKHELVDLAGLITPEVVPFMKDEEWIGDYLRLKQVDYLVTFPGWYPTLTSGLESVFGTGAIYSPDLGGENMVVYAWRN